VRIRVDPAVKGALSRLRRELRAEGMDASPNDIASAVICGTTAPQADGMLRRFNMDRAKERSA
jgi:hypothetical protein